LGLDGQVPNHSTFSKNRHGRFRQSVFSQHAVLAGGDLNRAPTTPYGLPPG
jgi:hypothetical protein